MAELVQTYIPAAMVGLEKLFSLILFNYLICNGEAHLKNYEVLETIQGDYIMSPAYYLINTSLHVDDAVMVLNDCIYPIVFLSSSMINKMYFFVFLFLMTFMAACDNSDQTDESGNIEAIHQMSSERADAFNRGDSEGIAIYFTETGLLMAPGSPVAQGRSAVADYYQQIFDEYETILESGYDEVEVSGDLAFGRGTAYVTLIPRDGGEPVTATSKYINILQRQPDGTWLTTHDIWNEND